MPGPLLVLGVRRSGTTLLRVMLDRHPQHAVPDESYFVPQLARRHPGRPDIAAFTDDLRRTRRLQELGIDVDEVARRLRPGMTTGEAIGAVFATYAAAEGKERWGDKTPLYMQHLPLLERLFPDALYVHLMRDGRDAALSFLAVPRGIMTEGWGYPRTAAGFACQWRSEVLAARALGARVGPARYLEVRYEELVAAPEATLRTVCAFAGLEFDPGMTGYVGNVDVSRQPHQTRLLQAPTVGVRDWRSELPAEDIRAFEAIAGDVLAAAGYAVTRRRPTLQGRMRCADYRIKTAAWNAVAAYLQRSPLWRRRHPLSEASAPPAGRR